MSNTLRSCEFLVLPSEVRNTIKRFLAPDFVGLRLKGKETPLPTIQAIEKYMSAGEDGDVTLDHEAIEQAANSPRRENDTRRESYHAPIHVLAMVHCSLEQSASSLITAEVSKPSSHLLLFI
jgi:hypothetical protein